MGGLMDYKARFYSPYLNHFIQPDTLIPDPSNPQDLNRFGYVQNNPINYNDPSGHCLTGAVLDTIACIGLLLVFSSMSDAPKNYSQEEAETRSDTFYLGLSMVTTAESIKNPLADKIFDTINCIVDVDNCVATWSVTGQIPSHNSNSSAPQLPSPKPFGNKGTIVLTEAEFDDFGSSYGKDWAFIARSEDVDAFQYATKDEIERRLGRSFPENAKLLRADIDDISSFDPRVPNSSHSGNSQYIPGGVTSGGLPERIINPINLKDPRNARVSPLKYIMK